MAAVKGPGRTTRKPWDAPSPTPAGSDVGDILSVLAGASLDDFEELYFNAARDAACCKDLLDVTLPGRETTNVVALTMAGATVARTERVRLALVAGQISEDRAFELFGIIAAAMMVEHRARILAELRHLHDVVLGVTDGDPERVYRTTDERRVVSRAHASVRAHGGTIHTLAMLS